MSLRRRVLRGTAVLTLGQVLSQAIAFARNIVVARLLSPHDVGIAATLAITLSLVELLADVSMDKLIIQADDGNDPRLQATAHLLSVFRGICQAVGLFFLSWPLSRLFDVPEALWAFQCVAVGPLIKGFVHLDVSRLQRDLRFMPATLADIAPQCLALAVVWPLAVWLGDYRVVLFATLLQAGLYTVLTHLLSERRYVWSWDPGHAGRMLTFGWPLMLNGALLFAINQGDRVAIGAAYSKEALAVWSNAVLLSSAPLLILGKVAISVALPILSRCRSDRATFDDRYKLCMQGLACVAALVATPLILAGGPLMAILFGPAYAQAGAYIGLLAIAQSLRICRIGPTLGSLVHADTTNVALGNSVRLLGLGLTVFAIVGGAPLAYVAGAAIVGESAAFAVSCFRLRHKRLLSLPQNFAPLLPLMLVFCAIGGIWLGGSDSLSDRGSIWSALIAIALLLLVLPVVYRRLRREPVLFLAALRGANG